MESESKKWYDEYLKKRKDDRDFFIYILGGIIVLIVLFIYLSRSPKPKTVIKKQTETGVLSAIIDPRNRILEPRKI